MEKDGDKGASFCYYYAHPPLRNVPDYYIASQRKKVWGMGMMMAMMMMMMMMMVRRGVDFTPQMLTFLIHSHSVSLFVALFSISSLLGNTSMLLSFFARVSQPSIHRVDMQQQPEGADSIVTVFSSSAHFLSHFTTSSSFPFICPQNSLLHRHIHGLPT